MKPRADQLGPAWVATRAFAQRPSLRRLLGHPRARVEVTVVFITAPRAKAAALAFGYAQETPCSASVRCKGVGAICSVRRALGALGRSLCGYEGTLVTPAHLGPRPGAARDVPRADGLTRWTCPRGPGPWWHLQDSVHLQWEAGAVLCQRERCHRVSVSPRACSAYSRWWCCRGRWHRPGPCPPGKVRPRGRGRHVRTRRCSCRKR